MKTENRNTARFETRLRLRSNRHKNFGEVVAGRFRYVCDGAFRVCLHRWCGDGFRRYSLVVLAVVVFLICAVWRILSAILFLSVLLLFIILFCVIL